MSDRFSSPANEQPSGVRHEAVAPVWHTAAVLALLITFCLAAALSGSVSPLGRQHSRIANYLLIIVLEWALVGWIRAAARSRGVSLREIIGGSWPRFTGVLRDSGIAIAFLFAALVIMQVLGHLLKISPSAGIRNLIPRTGLEIVFYLFTALTAGICEELIFRGYLLRQFSAWTQSTGAAVVLQGVVFGTVHGYQGWKYMLVIAVFGSLFGLLAVWRQSLRAGMIAHFVQDGVGGLVARHVLR